MTAKEFNLDKMRVASPCPAGWENMDGNTTTITKKVLDKLPH